MHQGEADLYVVLFSCISMLVFGLDAHSKNLRTASTVMLGS